MTDEAREYSGAALNSFILGLSQSKPVIDKILADVGVESIDPERWYDGDWALDIYYRIAREVGPAAVSEVGRKMIETAEFPPGIDGVEAAMQTLGEAFRLNTRGPGWGDIVCTLDDEHSATLDWTAEGPCALNVGIIQGVCSRYGATALIEHGGKGCKDDGASTCVYHVSW